MFTDAKTSKRQGEGHIDTCQISHYYSVLFFYLKRKTILPKLLKNVMKGHFFILNG